MSRRKHKNKHSRIRKPDKMDKARLEASKRRLDARMLQLRIDQVFLDANVAGIKTSRHKMPEALQSAYPNREELFFGPEDFEEWEDIIDD
jgi:hypothetical protein